MKLRKATADDALAVLEWRNDPVSVAMSKSGAVNPEEHVKWFGRAVNDHNREIFIATDDDRPVGMVRFDRSEGGWLVSITVASADRGKGYGSLMLSMAMTPGRSYMAEILPENAISLRLFGLCGYAFAGMVDGFVRMERAA